MARKTDRHLIKKSFGCGALRTAAKDADADLSTLIIESAQIVCANRLSVRGQDQLFGLDGDLNFVGGVFVGIGTIQSIRPIVRRKWLGLAVAPTRHSKEASDACKENCKIILRGGVTKKDSGTAAAETVAAGAREPRYENCVRSGFGKRGSTQCAIGLRAQLQRVVIGIFVLAPQLCSKGAKRRIGIAGRSADAEVAIGFVIGLAVGFTIGGAGALLVTERSGVGSVLGCSVGRGERSGVCSVLGWMVAARVAMGVGAITTCGVGRKRLSANQIPAINNATAITAMRSADARRRGRANVEGGLNSGIASVRAESSRTKGNGSIVGRIIGSISSSAIGAGSISTGCSRVGAISGGAATRNGGGGGLSASRMAFASAKRAAGFFSAARARRRVMLASATEAVSESVCHCGARCCTIS